jgi:hypothetical protein
VDELNDLTLAWKMAYVTLKRTIYRILLIFWQNGLTWGQWMARMI